MSHEPRPYGIASLITVVLTACEVTQMRSVAHAADLDRPARIGVESDFGEHGVPHRSRWNGGHGAHPSDNVRIHVGPVLPYGFGPYTVPHSRDYRSRAGYHVVDKATTSPSIMPASTMPDATTYLSWALQAFRSRHYGEAMRLLKHALIEDEKNGRLHLLLSQAQLAATKYEASAESLHRGLALLDRADWGYVVHNRHRLLANDDYDSHLKTLDRFIGENPRATFAKFLRGYHALFLGQKEAASENLRRATESTRYVKAAFGLLEAMGADAVDGRHFEELPAPADSATEPSR